MSSKKEERSALQTLYDNMASLKRKYLTGKITFGMYRKQSLTIQQAIRDQEIEVR